MRKRAMVNMLLAKEYLADAHADQRHNTLDDTPGDKALQTRVRQPIEYACYR